VAQKFNRMSPVNLSGRLATPKPGSTKVIKIAGVIFSLMLITALAAHFLTPREQDVVSTPSLEITIPKSFGTWRAMTDHSVQVSVAEGVDQPYDQTLQRTYVNSQGESVMLAVAWGQRQRQDIKVHRPEVCYPAQGYTVLNIQQGKPIAVRGRDKPIPTVSLLTENRGKFEAVRYWIRIGERYGGDGLGARWHILQEGFKGRIPDGILVRASQRVSNPAQVPHAQAVMEEFLAELTVAAPPAALTLLVR
jgi:EpsI family protein